ncbi:Kinesin light chain [Seminavis robusta]|uniref:Kinesin light chain n=1 Tax=Seminavis robusta TaxID=568900 RepID=A0A9N8E1M4_9STRA|nr:Kinesin light chain [Seminavis robusta]|eukprot:Sro561_g166750.1 Kinesin light chain (268) ;mRNA; r:5940-6907
MPPAERNSLEQAVIHNGSGTNALYETLGKTRVQDAKATDESDRLAILRKVESDVGYQRLNSQVNNLLRQWMVDVLTHRVETRENTNDIDYVRLCNTVGLIFRHGQHEEARNSAMNLHQSALIVCETTLVYWTFLYAKGDFDGALAKYQEALDIQELAVDKNHADTAIIYNNIGSVLRARGGIEGALSNYQASLEVGEAVLGKNHPHTAFAYNNISSVLCDKGDLDGALSQYQKCLNILEPQLGSGHHKTQLVLSSIAVCKARGAQVN